MATTLGSVVIQDLTYTQKQLGNTATLSYLNGGVAGSESVSVVGSAITITIASGTSTATQIKAAFDAKPEAVFLAGCTISGTGSNVQYTCKSASLSGGVAAAKASKTIGDILYTAKATGTGGNSTTVRYIGDKAFTVTTVTDATHLVVSSTTDIFAGDTIVQGAFSTTVTSVTDGTNLVVGSTTSWTGAATPATTAVIAGTEIVGVTASAITVRIKNGVSTASSIRTRVAAFGAADALVDTASAGTSQSNPQFIASALSATALVGGLAATAPSTIVQDITVTSLTTGTTKNGKTWTYTTGATAGAEVVTIDGSENISVQIQNGVSTATQIRTAMQAAGAFTALYSSVVSGTGATAQKTVNGAVTTGDASDSTRTYYTDQSVTALTASYVRTALPGAADQITIFNDETAGTAKNIIVSFDGTNQAYFVKAAEKLELYECNGIAALSLKFGTAAPAYRVMVKCK